MTKYFYIFILVFFFVLSVNSQIYQGIANGGSGLNQITIDFKVNATTNTVTMIFTGPSTRWFGFGFAANSMSTGAYTILSNVSGSDPKEYNQVFHQTPIYQSNQNLSVISTTNAGGVFTSMVTRPLSTSDINDYSFQAAPVTISLIWAYGYGTSMSQHQAFGVTNLTLTSLCNLPVTYLPDFWRCIGDSALILGNYETQTGTYTDTLQSVSGCDSVLSQTLTISMPYISSLVHYQKCFSDSILLMGNYYIHAGIYSDTLQGIYGCDSIINFEITNFQIPDTSISLSGDTLYGPLAMNSYQWYDCNSGIMLQDDTNNFLLPVSSGLYRLYFNDSNYCSYSSNCYNYIKSNLIVSEIGQIKIYPNPVEEKIYFEFSKISPNRTLRILTIDGREILFENLSKLLNLTDLSNIARGLYIVRIEEDNRVIYSQKIVK